MTTRTENAAATIPAKQRGGVVVATVERVSPDALARPKTQTPLQLLRPPPPANSDTIAHQTGDSPIVSRQISRILHAIDRRCENLLSPLAKDFCRTLPELKRLGSIPNSTTAYTKPFGHSNFSRLRHSKDAAAEVWDLKVPLADYEKKVLELALLFHDVGHVPGSHAFDNFFYTLPGAPRLLDFGFPSGRDYHEYHGPILVGKGEHSSYIREKCGEKLFGDLMAVITFDDKRPLAEKIADYGAFTPSLSDNQIQRLYELKDRLDRASYLKFDYLLAGYHDHKVIQALERTEAYLASLVLTESNVACLERAVPGEGYMAHPEDPFQGIVEARGYHFAQLPAHPVNALITAAIQQASWEQLQAQGFSAREMSSPAVYNFIRGEMLQGHYAEVLGPRLTGQLFNRDDCITYTTMPLVTLERSHFSERGMRALERVAGRSEVVNGDSAMPHNLVTDLCKAPLFDATFLELQIRQKVQEHFPGFDLPFFCLVSGEGLDKEMSHISVADDSADSVFEKKYRDQELRNLKGQVIIAVQPYDRDGNFVDPRPLRALVVDVMRRCGWLRDNDAIESELNERVFVNPINPSAFTADILAKIDQIPLKWKEDLDSLEG